jgi:hypothetical protein
MPLKFTAPKPETFPCQIGIDAWRKRNKRTKRSYKFTYKYTDAQADGKGWCDPRFWLPLPFDLCILRTNKRTCTGWWTGKEWSGLRLRAPETVLYWKKANDETIHQEDNSKRNYEKER